MMIDENKNPFNKIDETIVYDNKWISVKHANIITPKNTAGIYGTVHFKNYAIGIIPIDADGNTYLVGQYRYALDAYSWEIPEGGCPPNEDPEVAAHRELEEEAGIIASQLTKITEFYTSNSVTDEKAIIYLAEGLKFSTPNPEPTEDLKIRKVPFKDALGMIFDGQITDALTIIGLLMLKEKL